MTLTLALVLALLSSLGLLSFVLFRGKNNSSELLLKQQIDHLKENLDSSSRLVHQQMGQLTKELSDRLQESTRLLQDGNKQVGERLDHAAKVVGLVQNQLGKLEMATDRVFEEGKKINTLHEILKAPKLRGSMGELFLSDLLAQVLPKDGYELQYTFKSREKVDAIIRSAQGFIAVDSKFPLENFMRILETKSEDEKKTSRRAFYQDVKKHIDSIASKYILPDEGTLDLALMYIPAENVYYEIIIKNETNEKDLLSYAQEKKVFPVSPNSFYAYLQTIAIGLRGMQLQEGVKEIQQRLAQLHKDFGEFGREFALVGTHLGNASSNYDKADKRLQRLGEKLGALGLEEEKRTELKVLSNSE